MNVKNIVALVIFILIAQVTGVVGSFFTVPAIGGWYEALNKPFFQPPNWIFGPVWVGLYTLMGTAAYLVWRKRGENPEAKGALTLFGIHLVFNALWSVIFFGFQNPFLALIEIIILWALIVLVGWRFLNISVLAGYLLLLYLAWVSFALVLNYSIWQLN